MIHFVYRAPRYNDFIGRLKQKVSLNFPTIKPPWRNGNNLAFRKPIKAPLSITYNLLNAFKKIDAVRFYDLYENTTCKLNENDIFIGVPLQAIDGSSWDNEKNFKVTAKTLEAYRNNKNKFIIMPYTHDSIYNSSTTELIKHHGENVIIICGKIWTDTWDKSPINKYVKNLLRVDMAIDAEDYPFIKKSFNPIGKRKYLYIGHTKHYKNTIELERIASSIPNFEGGHIGQGNIKGWKKISDNADLNTEFMKEIANEYDIFINTSSADAQATTILECMCFGFVAACTPESGYKYDSITELRINDTAYNVKALNYLQNAPESELFVNTCKNREIAIQSHNWNTFCNKIINFIYEKRTKS